MIRKIRYDPSPTYSTAVGKKFKCTNNKKLKKQYCATLSFFPPNLWARYNVSTGHLTAGRHLVTRESYHIDFI